MWLKKYILPECRLTSFDVKKYCNDNIFIYIILDGMIYKSMVDDS